MKVRLRAKMLILYAVIALAGYLVLIFLGNAAEAQTRNALIKTLHRNALDIAQSSLTKRVPDPEYLELVASACDAEIWIMNLKGEVLARTGAREDTVKAADFRLPAENYYVEGDFFGVFDRPVLSVYAPVMTDIVLSGYVVIHYDEAKIQKTAATAQLFHHIVYGILMLLFALALLFFDIFVNRDLQKLVKAGREYANDNLSYPMDVRRRDEIGELALITEDLAHRINTASDDQKQFLANISHDFRSPLTSIRGYIAAIQDGTIPPEMQKKYLNVVLSETDRLTNLANGLLDLAQLENGIILNRTDFDLNDLIRELLPTFEGRVKEKNISFDVTFEEPHLFVNADRARITQVLHNLVDNAIKFSGPDASIDIATRLTGGRVFVSVKDHGCGIEKENIPKIWTRFYKTDTSRGKDKKGTGLGLSIVREIIQAHKEHIDVISTKNVGTEFIFTLTATGEND